MDREAWLRLQPYGLKQKEKDVLFEKELVSLTAWHKDRCLPYRNLCESVEEAVPLLPVSAFRDRDLASVPMEAVSRVLTSSGTSSQVPSRVFLDAETSRDQQIVLTRILSEFLGPDRLPMLILDTKDVFSDPSKYTARGAGIAGFAMLSRSRTYALDENMNLDLDALYSFAEKNKGQRVLLFGFTYMVRQYFTLPLLARKDRPDLSGAVLIHGGGWKKMEALKVTPEAFRQELEEAAGIREIHNYYGMAEQLGSIFMECEYGRLHASSWSDIRTVRAEDLSPCDLGEQGLVELRSVLPRSYPGHRILTEDLGRILGVDDCPCGRGGFYFAIDGRAPKTAVRGCSDTFSGLQAVGDMGRGTPGEAWKRKAGVDAPVLVPLAFFSGEALQCLEDFSESLLKDPSLRGFPDAVALGFWLRPAHLNQLKERYLTGSGENPAPASHRRGKGQVFVCAPSNMPALFAYNWAVAMLAGCPCTIRLSSREDALAQVLCEKLQDVLSRPCHKSILERTRILTYPRDDALTGLLSRESLVRILWGGDEAVAHLHAIPGRKGCLDILFPHRFSIAVIREEYVASLPSQELEALCDRFYRDTYEADQNACSSPKMVFWIGDGKETDRGLESQGRQRWWDTLGKIVQSRYGPSQSLSLAKYSLFVSKAMEEPLLVTWRSKNLLVGKAPEGVGPETLADVRFGFFYECSLKGLDGLPEDFTDKLQTLVAIGLEKGELQKAMERCRTYPALRIVPAGSALTFDPVWDNQDLLMLLSEPDSDPACQA